MSQHSARLIDPKAPGQRHLDLKAPVFDEDAVARADEALRAMSGSFQQWLDDEVARLQAARLAAASENWSDASMEALMLAAHDLKGLGSTYDYPIVTMIAASLCRLIDSEEGKTAVRTAPALLLAHVDTIRAVVRDGVKTLSHPMGKSLLTALEAHVEALNLPQR